MSSLTLLSKSSNPSRTLIKPHKWQQILKQIPKEAILPNSEEHKLNAFFGDKLLGAAAATAIQQSHLNSNNLYSESSASRLVGTALSNRFLAARFSTILPEEEDKLFEKHAQDLSTHGVGTMVEAAVAAVHKQDGGDEAIQNLVDWLLEEALSLNHDMNAKGRLLELGGTISQTKRIGGTDHKPIFKAVASYLPDKSTDAPLQAEGVGTSKKVAQQEAARQLLQKLGYESAILEEPPSTLTYEPPTQNWNVFDRDDDDLMTRLELTNGETARDWWTRHAIDPKHAFRAAMLAPIVFADTILSVDSWTRRQSLSEDDDSVTYVAVLMVITYRNIDTDELQHACWVEQSSISGTRARSNLGLVANQCIAKATRTRI